MRLLAFLILIILINCTPRRNEALTPDANKDSVAVTDKSKETFQNEFAEFISIIPKLDVPINIYCKTCCDYPMFERRESGVATKFTPEGLKIVGLLRSSKDFFVILTTYTGIQMKEIFHLFLSMILMEEKLIGKTF